MSVGQADLAKAINVVWDASGLNDLFKALWPAGVAAVEFPVLHEGQAGGDQPWPYCVFEMPGASTATRMSKGVSDLWETRDAAVMFRVHSSAVSGDDRSAKQIAAYLVEEIMKVFGGHPTVSPTDLELDNGNFLNSIFQNDFAVREDEDHYVWTVSYIFRLDVPIMA